MLWLDSTYPVDSSDPGAKRGTCPTTSGVPTDVESKQANAHVIFSDIKFGPIGSTVPPQVQLQCPQPHRLPRHHLTVLVVLWTIALTCAQLMFSRNAWNHAIGAAQVCSSEQSFFFYIKCDLACLRVSDASMFFTF